MSDEPTRAGEAKIAYSPAEAAEMLGISRSLFYRDVLPRLRCAYVGRRRVIPRRELEWFIERQADVPDRRPSPP